jgi:hypothetical protein
MGVQSLTIFHIKSHLQVSWCCWLWWGQAAGPFIAPRTLLPGTGGRAGDGAAHQWLKVQWLLLAILICQAIARGNPATRVLI